MFLKSTEWLITSKDTIVTLHIIIIITIQIRPNLKKWTYTIYKSYIMIHNQNLKVQISNWKNENLIIYQNYLLYYIV